nr:MAG TPA: hypothetical protein [Inoviridae sp.]
MLVSARILLLSLLVLLLLFRVPCSGALSLLPLSLVPCLLTKVGHTLSAQLGACALTHAPAPALSKKTRFKPGFLSFFLIINFNNYNDVF